jgi:hypothetical protein
MFFDADQVKLAFSLRSGCSLVFFADGVVARVVMDRETARDGTEEPAQVRKLREALYA